MTNNRMEHNMNKELERDLEKFVQGYLEDYSFEDLLEELDVDPVDAFILLFSAGAFNPENLREILTSDV